MDHQFAVRSSEDRSVNGQWTRLKGGCPVLRVPTVVRASIPKRLLRRPWIASSLDTWESGIYYIGNNKECHAIKWHLS